MTTNPINPLQMRKKTGLNQTAFWSRIGVTQSGGSRYESGRAMPKPVEKLLVVAYGTEKQSEKAVKVLRGAA